MSSGVQAFYWRNSSPPSHGLYAVGVLVLVHVLVNVLVLCRASAISPFREKSQKVTAICRSPPRSHTAKVSPLTL